MPRPQVIRAAVVLLALLGCAGGDGLKRVPVQGKLTAGGVPLDCASIQFLPMGSTQGKGGFGRSDQDGNFELTDSGGAGKGVVAGEYKVRISRLTAPDGTPLAPDAKPAETGAKESLPREYASIADTPLICTVPEAGGVVNINIPVALKSGK